MADEVAPILVATFGNPMAADDALGHLVADRMRARPIAGAEVVELGTRPVSLLHHLDGRTTLYIVDAVWIAGRRPGGLVDIDWFGPDRPLLEVETRSGSTHTTSVAHAVALAEKLALLPRAVRVLGLTVRWPELGRPPTGAVLERVGDLVRRIEWRAGLVSAPRPCVDAGTVVR